MYYLILIIKTAIFAQISDSDSVQVAQFSQCVVDWRSQALKAV